MSNQLRLLLLIVVISGALCTVEDYVIMSQCAHNKAIHLAAEGTVSATDISQTQNITIVGLPDYVNNDFKIALYAKETQRYLCFNENWKLVGMKELRDTCYFNETIVHGYFVFRSVVDLQRRVGFTHRGKAVGPKKNVNDACYLFTKIQADQFFHQHTNYFAPKSKITSSIPTAATTTTTTATTAATTQTTTTAGKLKTKQTTATATATATLSTTSAASATITRTATVNKNKTNRNNNNNNKYNRNNGNRNNNNNNNNKFNHQIQQQQNANGGHSRNRTNLSSNSKQQQQQQQQQKQLGLRQQQKQQQKHHQVRHHHNDPNLIARRQQHEHKQKRRQRNRTRTTTTTITATVSSVTGTTPLTTKKQMTTIVNKTTPTTTTKASTIDAVMVKNKLKSLTTTSTKSAQMKTTAATPTHVAHNSTVTSPNTTTTTTKATIAQTSTSTVANKRKGRRRKGERVHKKNSQQQQQLQHSQQMQLPPDNRITVIEPTLTTYVADNNAATSTVYDASTFAATFETNANENTSNIAAGSMLPDDTTSTMATKMMTTPTLDTFTTTINDFNVSESSLPLTTTIKTNETVNVASTKAIQATTVNAFDSSILLPTTITITLNNNNNSIMYQQQLQPTHIVGDTPTATTAKQTYTDNWSTTDTDETESDDILQPTTSILNATTTFVDTEFNAWNSSDIDWQFTNINNNMSDDDNATSTTSNENDSMSNSSNEISGEFADFYSELNATSQTTKEFENDNVTVDFNNFAINKIEKPDQIITNTTTSTISDNIITPTAKFVSTLATLYRKWKTTLQQFDEHNQTTTTVPTTTATPKTTTAMHDSERHGTTNYTFSTSISHTHKHSHHRNISHNKDFAQLQQQFSNTDSHKLNRHTNKLHNNSNMNIKPAVVMLPTTTQHARRTMLPTTMATFSSVESNHDQFTTISNDNNNENNNNRPLLSVDKHMNPMQTNNTIWELPIPPTSATSTTNTARGTFLAAAVASTTATKKLLRQYTQKLQATPFHQITYVRNNAGDIDMDNIDNISVYPDSLEADSRLTIVSGYLPTSATPLLPESIRIGQRKIEKEQKRMRQRRNGHKRRYA